MTSDLIYVGTDGGCNPNPGPGGWAWVADDGRYGCGSFAKGTNNIGELLALKEALLAFPDTPILIEYDSQYAHGCVTSWGPSWRAKGTVGKANQELVYDILDIVDERTATLEWEWVHGHDESNAHPLNTAADSLCTRMCAVRGDSRESGVMEIDRTLREGAPPPRAGNRKKSRKRGQSEFGNMGAIAAIAGGDARSVGVWLREHGLLTDGQASRTAVAADLAQMSTLRDGTIWTRWHTQRIAALMQSDEYRSTPASVTLNAPAEPADE